MGKRLTNGQCIHCLKIVGDITEDHVFPRAWYPDSTPPGLAKWKAPSCRTCNHDYGKLEENLLLRLGLCLDRDTPEAAGIAEKVINALNPARAKSPTDFRIRLKKARKLISEGQPISPQTNAFFLNSSPAKSGVTIANADLKKLGEKIVRGLTWVYLKRVIDPQYSVGVNTAQGPLPAFDDDLKSLGERYDRGPGIEVRWARLPDDPICGLFLITIFGRLTLRSTVIPQVLRQHK